MNEYEVTNESLRSFPFVLINISTCKHDDDWQNIEIFW